MRNSVECNIEDIIEEYSNYVYKIVNNITGEALSYEDKEEIVADTFYLLWKNQSKIKGNIKAYLSTIARNCSYDKLRKNKVFYEYNEQMDSGIILDYSETLIIKEKLSKLTKDEIQVFELFYVYGLKIKEISKRINKRTGTIKVMLHRIRKELRED